jgi:hypothetical protein
VWCPPEQGKGYSSGYWATFWAFFHKLIWSPGHKWIVSVKKPSNGYKNTSIK